MVNLHQICRLCMVEIGVEGIDCLQIDEIRNAIDNLYKVKIKAEDECSKRVCAKCFGLTVDFMMHQRTVRDTQDKIEELIKLQKQVKNVSGIDIKVEVQGPNTDATQQPVEEVATSSTQDRTSSAQSSDSVRTRNANSNANVDDTQSARSAPGNNRKSNRPKEASEQSGDGKRRRRNALDDTGEHDASSRAKRSKSSTRSLRSDEHSAFNVPTTPPTRTTPARNATHGTRSTPNRHESKEIDAKQSERHRSKSMHERTAALPILRRNRRRSVVDGAPSTSASVQGTILKYLSKPSCTKCDAVIKTHAEARFHEKCHQKKYCPICKKSVRTNDVRNHVFTCFLLQCQLTTSEMLLYVTPCSVRLFRENDYVAANKVEGRLVNPKIEKRAANADSSDLESEIIRRPAKSNNTSRSILIDSSSDEEVCDTNAASATTQQTVNVVTDRNSATETEPAVEMPSHQKKVARRESTAQRQEKCALALSKNTALPVIWNRLPEGNRVFYAKASYAKIANHYITIEPIPLDPKVDDRLDKIRLKMAAKVRSAPTDGGGADKRGQTPRKINGANRSSFSTRISISDGDRLAQHKNAIVMFPPTTFGNNDEVPRNQPSQVKDRRKSTHGIPVATAVYNRTIENGPSSTVLISLGEQPNAAATYSPVAQQPSRPQSTPQYGHANGQTSPPAPQSPYARQIVYYASSSNGVSVPTTSAAALASSAATPPKISSPSVALAAARTNSISPAPHQQILPRPPPNVPNKSVVKVLSVNELNSRAVQMNNNNNHNSSNNNNNNSNTTNNASNETPNSQFNNVQRMRSILPKPGPEHASNNSSQHSYVAEDNTHPIHVTLIRRGNNDLELQLTQDGNRISYESLTDSQRQEVQKSLLNNDVWLQMLDHVKCGTPTSATMELFRSLLPQRECDHFFRTIYAEKHKANNK